MAARLGCALIALAALALPASAGARPVSATTDGRPNILVVMTDDQAVADVRHMPNVRRMLAARGTTFADAIDSYPLCCPARATFITGQYAHNHGVASNFWPHGWYGMEGRANTLPAWLQHGGGYRTALVGKWLNGYGSRDAHGEVPAGFDIWRGLLDVSAYDYHNFVMNQDGRLKVWGDPEFARKLVRFAKIQTIDNQAGFAGVLAALTEQFGPAPYEYWGAEDPADYSPDVTGRITERLVRAEGRSRKPFFIWWAPAAPHREDVATTLMGRPGRDPRPAKRHADESSRFRLPRGPAFNEADLADKPSNVRDRAPLLTEADIAQLQLDYEGRIGSLLAVDEHVERLVRTLRETGQLRNTLIVFLSDNGWLHGEHRIPGDKYLPYEESIRIPLIMRGPGVPAGRTVRGQIANIDLTPTLLDFARVRPGRRQDGISLLPTIRGRRPLPRRAIEIEATAPLFRQDLPANRWDRPYRGVRTNRYTYVVWHETDEVELYDRRRDPHQLRNVASDPAYAKVRARLAARLAKLNRCRGRSCNVKP